MCVDSIGFSTTDFIGDMTNSFKNINSFALHTS